MNLLLHTMVKCFELRPPWRANWHLFFFSASSDKVPRRSSRRKKRHHLDRPLSVPHFGEQACLLVYRRTCLLSGFLIGLFAQLLKKSVREVMGFDSLAGQVGYRMANCSPPLRCFCGAELSRRYTAEMAHHSLHRGDSPPLVTPRRWPTTRYTAEMAHHSLHRGDGPPLVTPRRWPTTRYTAEIAHHPLHASASYHEYDKDLISFFSNHMSSGFLPFWWSGSFMRHFRGEG